jgi:hypothetical protein
MKSTNERAIQAANFLNKNRAWVRVTWHGDKGKWFEYRIDGPHSEESRWLTDQELEAEAISCGMSKEVANGV